MKTSTTAERLAEYMRIFNMRQVDILEAAAPYAEELGVKIQKSEISQYLSGKFEPGHDKIYALSVALGVNPVWLMGYDAPMYNTSELDRFNCPEQQKEKPTEQTGELYDYAAELLMKLSPANQKIIMKLTPQNIDRLFGYAERLLEEQSNV
jgi:transcriptional regulator with XRE-family HTH domain